MKKTICILLSLIMLLSGLISCSQENAFEETDDTVEVEEAVPVETRDLGGKTYKILSTPSNYGVTSITVEDSATVLNAAIFKRNMIVKERLNIDIFVEEEETPNKMDNAISTIASSGDLTYDLYYGNSSHVLPLSTKGYLAKSSELENVKFEEAWWNAVAAKKIAIKGDTYALIGDADIHWYESIYITVLNKDISEEEQLPNLAELALSGNWTWDMMYQYTTDAYVDADNSGGKTDGDRFGFATGYNLAGIALLSSGEDIMTYDKSNYPSFSGFNVRTVDIFSNIKKWFYDSNSSFVSPRDNNLFETVTTFHDIFVRGDALFYSEPIGSLQKLKEVDYEYTVLPVPKYDAADKYITTVMHYAYCFGIPMATSDYDELGVFLDNIMYQSHINVIPTYLEQIVSLQRVRNEDSYQILSDIVFKSEMTISLLQIYDFNGLNTAIRDCAVGSDNRGLATIGASLSRNMSSVIENALGAKE